MSRRKYPRLWSPIAVGIMGSALAAAVGVSRGWGAASGVEVAVFLVAAFVYLLGGSDSDAGAVLGNRPDERQVLLRLKSQALAMKVVFLGALIGWAVAIALKGLYGLLILFSLLAVWRTSLAWGSMARTKTDRSDQSDRQMRFRTLREILTTR